MDVPGDSSTTSTIGIGGTVAGAIEVSGDHDWYRITLTAGQQIEILMTSAGDSPMEDPYLRIRDASGEILAFNDDGGTGRSSRLAYEAAYSGTYYIDAAAWTPDEPIPDYSEVGTYELTVKTFVAPTEWTNDQITQQLTAGFWEGATHHFDVTQGGMITVNLSGLQSDTQHLAREALALWGDVIGVAFSEVGSDAQITFDDDEEGAHASAEWNGSIISAVDVNVAADWSSGSGDALNSYRFQTFIHEIGHALGLGHAGNYNETATYPFDASYSNDGWPITVMSYFSQGESSFYASRGFSEAYINTPMIADIIAMNNLYGLSTTTRTGDTVYGIANGNYGVLANRDVFNAARYPDAALTIFDSAGRDTLNYSAFAADQRIDLNAEAFSSVAGLTGNLGIARGTVIENAIGGSGHDVLVGNAANNLLIGNAGQDGLLGGSGDDVLTGGSGADSLTGGSGSDIFSDTRANLNGDTIFDLTNDDRILFSDAALGSFTYSLSGSVLSYSGGSLTLSGVTSAQVSAVAGSNGGVEVQFSGLGTGTGSTTGSGTNGSDRLAGTSANDILYGFDGHDVIWGGAGTDIIEAGNGNDVLAGGDETSFDNGREVDQLNGGAGNDTIFAGYGDVVDGGSGFDTVGLSYVGATHGIDGDTAILKQGLPLVAGAGTIRGVERYSDIALTAFNDRMVIGDQADPAVVRSWDGDDHLIGQEMSIDMYGGNGNDLLVGGRAADVLYGETGNDKLIGFFGADVLWGGEGSDTFYFTTTDATDTIKDFQSGSDMIDLTAIDANLSAAGDQAFSFIGSAAFSGNAGELRTYSGGTDFFAAGDMNGDGTADLLINLGSVQAASSHFFL